MPLLLGKDIAMGEDNLFSGKDRVEFCGAFQRPIRKGSLEQLKVSDFQRVKTALQNHDAATAKSHLELLHPLYVATTGTFLEWSIAIPYFLAKSGHAEMEPEITKESHKIWLEGASQCKNMEAVKVMQGILESIDAKTIHELRSRQQSNQPNQLTDFLAKPAHHYAKLVESMNDQKYTEALGHFINYFEEMRTLHDLSTEFVSAYGGVMQEKISQETASDVMQQSLESCAFVGGIWGLVRHLTPEQLAALLAEHLRCHFSGTNREGSVEIIEEEDKYRLVFAPCGTGQALRQRETKGLKKMPHASPETWNRSNAVPTYCSHCARNEITSISKLGHPAWVTEFNSDASKPCGWTIYKDPKLIPEHYFTRVGSKKNQS